MKVSRADTISTARGSRGISASRQNKSIDAGSAAAGES